MAKKRKNKSPLPAQPMKKKPSKIISWWQQHDEKLFKALIFSYFFLAPLPFISGFAPDGKVFFTLYDQPKLAFLIPAALLIISLFVFSLSYHESRKRCLWELLRQTIGIRLLLIFFAVMLLSLPAVLVWQNGLLQAAIYGVYLQFFIVLAVLFQQPGIFRASLYGTVLSLAVFCPLGILQFFGFQLPFLVPIKGPASTLGYRNPAAHYLVLNLPFAAYLAFSHWQVVRESREKSKKQLLIFLVLAGIVLMAFCHIFMTTTRTAILALMLYTFLLPFYHLLAKPDRFTARQLKKTLAFTIAAILVITGSLLAFPQSRQRVMKSVHKIGSSSILEARKYHWGNTLYMIKDHPFSGVGLGNWQFAYPLYMRKFAKDTCFTFKIQVIKSHNDYLQIAAESGLGALLLFLCLWGRQFYLAWKNASNPAIHYGAYPLFCALIAFSIIMMLSFPLQMAYSRMYFFYLLAMGESFQLGKKIKAATCITH